MFSAQLLTDRIKGRAKQQNIKLKDMLIALELNINTISQISDKKGLSCFPLGKIANYLDCSVDYLLGLTDNPNKNSSSPERDELLKDPRVLDLINALLSIPPDQRDRFLDELDAQLQLIPPPDK